MALHNVRGLACRGLAWLGVACLGEAWLVVACLGLSWLGVAWLGLSWFGLDWLGSAWLGLAWHDLAWLGLTWLGLILYLLANSEELFLWTSCVVKAYQALFPQAAISPLLSLQPSGKEYSSNVRKELH